MPRFFHPEPLRLGAAIALAGGAARHVQVLRLQPGDAITLFDGDGGEWAATIERIGRSDVRAAVGAHSPIEREATRAVHLAVGMPANERMDWLVEKATELGTASIQPLLTERSVLRLSSERADKKRAHWQAIVTAACEQCGRNRVPEVHRVLALPDWLAQLDRSPDLNRLLLSLDRAAPLLPAGVATGASSIVLSGPEGGLSAAEASAAQSAGFAPASLGRSVLRAETAALAALAVLTISTGTQAAIASERR